MYQPELAIAKVRLQSMDIVNLLNRLERTPFMTRTLVVILLQLIFALILSECRASDDRPCRNVIERMTIPAQINHRPVRLIIDTGSDQCGLDTDILDSMGIKVTGQHSLITPSRVITSAVRELVDLQLEGRKTHRTAIVDLNVAVFRSYGLFQFDGLLGTNILSHYVVTLTDGNIALHDAIPAEIDVHDLQSTEPMENARPVLPVVFPGVGEYRLRLDTGANHTCRVRRDVFDALDRNGKVTRGLRSKAADASGSSSDQTWILRELEVAGVRFQNVPLTIARDNALGMELLSHLQLTIDFPQQRILIGRPHHEVVERFPMNSSGIALAFFANDELKVIAVRTESAAGSAGIQTGDIVTQLNDNEPSSLSIDEVDEILSRTGRTISIRLRRESAEFTAELPLRLPFEYPPDWDEIGRRNQDFEDFLKAQGIGSPEPQQE
ncbi:MAG: aspartyl protease family protein [Planctomycetaceae bacterium]|nr:aspartyl protease family protein [Planctomycetaceae bacterium]